MLVAAFTSQLPKQKRGARAHGCTRAKQSTPSVIIRASAGECWVQMAPDGTIGEPASFAPPWQPHDGPVRTLQFDATKVITGGECWSAAFVYSTQSLGVSHQRLCSRHSFFIQSSVGIIISYGHLTAGRGSWVHTLWWWFRHGQDRGGLGHHHGGRGAAAARPHGLGAAPLFRRQ
jgi:hypothetical protein